MGWKQFTDTVSFGMRRTGKYAKWDDYVHRVPIPAGVTPTSVVIQGMAQAGIEFQSEAELPIPYAGVHNGAWFKVLGVAIEGDHVNISCQYQLHECDGTLKVRLAA